MTEFTQEILALTIVASVALFWLWKWFSGPILSVTAWALLRSGRVKWAMRLQHRGR